jgi:hypothetical protein
MAEDKKKAEVEASALDEITANVLYQEVKQGFREWEFDGAKYKTRFPVAKEENDGNWEYSRAFNRALKEGLPTSSEMDKIIRERGIWSEKDEDEISASREKIGSLEVILSKKDVKDHSKATVAIANELSNIRQSVISKTSEYQGFMSQTVESKADEAKTAYLVSTCTESADGSRVWNTVDEFLVDKRAGIVNTATYQYITFTAGLAQDYIEQLSETKYLRAGKDVDE